MSLPGGARAAGRHEALDVSRGLPAGPHLRDNRTVPRTPRRRGDGRSLVAAGADRDPAGRRHPVDEAELSGRAWRHEVLRRPTAEQDRDTLARLVEWDADPFEVELYERAADPQGILIDRAQRSRAGQHARRVRRLRDRQFRRAVSRGGPSSRPARQAPRSSAPGRSSRAGPQ